MPERFPVVLVDDGELDDVRDLLGELGIEFAHLRGGAVPRRLEAPRDLFLATMRRAALARAWPHSSDARLRPVRIAVVDEDSPSARSALRKLGFAYLVRRPFHPLALRLLLLRALYQGDERRGDARVPVGVDVSLRSGLRRRDALLADLSRGGCQLVTDRALPAGAKITLHLSRELLGEGDLALGGQILRCQRDARALADGGFQVAVRFQALKPPERAQLERFLARRDLCLGPAVEPRVEPLRPLSHEAAAPAPGPTSECDASRGRGPARTAGRVPEEGAPALEAAPAARPGPGAERRTVPPPPTSPAARPGTGAVAWRPPEPAAPPRPSAPPETEPPAARPPRLAAQPPTAPASSTAPRLGSALIRRPSGPRGRPPERRRHDRRAYDRRVLAEATAAMHRMLFGRDLSGGGMRVDRHPDLRVGSRLRIALYDAAREAPLVVDAVVARDDGARGFGLQFLAVGPELATRLEQLVATLPPVERLSDGESGALGSVVGEIVS